MRRLFVDNVPGHGPFADRKIFNLHGTDGDPDTRGET